MSALEKLAMLNPKTPRLGNVGRGGVPDLTPQDVAAMLCGLPKAYQYYALAAFAGDYSHLYTLRNYALFEIKRVSAIKLWIERYFPDTYQGRAKAQARLQRLVSLALVESLSDSTCKTCQGIGQIHTIGQRAQDCPKCRGAGRRAFDNSYRAKKVGMSVSAWRNYQTPYNIIRLEMIGWENVVADKLR